MKYRAEAVAQSVAKPRPINENSWFIIQEQTETRMAMQEEIRKCQQTLNDCETTIKDELIQNGLTQFLSINWSQLNRAMK